MNYPFLGTSGTRVSELCLGAMTFGRETTEAESQQIMDRFAAAGGTFIDTADGYSAGLSEQIVGRWLAQQTREDFVVATKVRFPMGSGPNQVGLGRKHIIDGVHASLRRMGLDYLDLYQVHAWDPATDLLSTLQTLDDLVRSGLVRHIGVSNFAGWQLQRAIDLQERYGLARFVSLQPQYSLLERGAELEVLSVAANEGIGVIPWGPLKGGWLSGKYRRGMSAPPAGSRVETAEKEGWFERWSNMNNEHTWNLLDQLHAVSEETGAHPVQVSLAWLLSRPVVTAPIIGVRTMAHLETALGAVDCKLETEQLSRLESASVKPLPYPYDFLQAVATPGR